MATSKSAFHVSFHVFDPGHLFYRVIINTTIEAFMLDLVWTSERVMHVSVQSVYRCSTSASSPLLFLLWNPTWPAQSQFLAQMDYPLLRSDSH